MARQPRSTDIGFKGGQVLSLRVEDDAYAKLRDALAAKDSGWHAVEAGDETIDVDLGQVIYVRRETGSRTVGF
jgi:hypothetical protein